MIKDGDRWIFELDDRIYIYGLTTEEGKQKALEVFENLVQNKIDKGIEVTKIIRNNYNTIAYFEDDSIIKVIPLNGNCRGYKWTRAWVPENISHEDLCQYVKAQQMSPIYTTWEMGDITIFHYK